MELPRCLTLKPVCANCWHLVRGRECHAQPPIAFGPERIAMWPVIGAPETDRCSNWCPKPEVDLQSTDQVSDTESPTT